MSADWMSRSCMGAWAPLEHPSSTGNTRVPELSFATSALKPSPVLQGAFHASWLDESDCVGAWESDAVVAVLFPTGGTLADVRRLDALQVLKAVRTW